MENLTSYIAGKWCAQSEKSLEVHHKYSGELIGKVSLASSKEVELAQMSSLSALGLLSKWSAEKKSQCLYHLANLVKEHETNLAKLISAEAGKPIGYAKGEIDRCRMTLELAASEALRLGGEVVPVDYGAGKGKMAQTKRFPIGPVYGIVPFNFPLNLAMHKLAPAIASGCPITLKPSPYTPLSLLYFARLIEQTDLPPGAVNIIVCSNEDAEKLLTSSVYKMFSFTGSPQVGWALKSKAGKKKVQLELGGNAAVIVDETADLKAAAETIAIGAFLYSGQICISTQRIYLEKSIKEEFLGHFIAAVKRLKVGDPAQEETLVGPLIASEHLKRIESWVEEAKSQGASILTGGKIKDEKHNLFEPTVLDGVKDESKIHCEEVFGPVAMIESFEGLEQVIERVNQSRFGLQAGFFTNRLDRMKKAFHEIEVGGLIINGIPGFRVDSMPYGGVKDSGLGREGLKYAIEEMTEPRLLIF